MNNIPGLNCILYTYEEIKEIINDKYHPMHEYIIRWFGDEYEPDEEYLIWTDSGNELLPGEYWLCNIKLDQAMSFKDINNLENNIVKINIKMED